MSFSWTRVGRWGLGWLLWCSFVCAHAAGADVHCTFSGLTLNPPAPPRIVVASSVQGGQVIYSTTMTSFFTCTGGVSGDVIIFSAQALSGSASPVSGVTNVSVTAGLSATPPGPGYGYISGLTGPCSVAGYANSSNKPFIQWSGSGTCTGQVGLGLSFSATTTGAVSGTIPSNFTAAYPVPGWLFAGWCSSPSCPSLNFVQGAVGVPGPTIPIQTLSSTCALTGPANLTVSLPTVSTSAFQGVGSAAGARRLAIAYNCSTSGGPMALSMAWTFEAPGHASGDYAILKNTGTANGVGVQIVDSLGNPVVSGAQSRQIASVANGTNTINYLVQYYQFGTSVTSGTVNATAQFTATYN